MTFVIRLVGLLVVIVITEVVGAADRQILPLLVEEHLQRLPGFMYHVARRIKRQAVLDHEPEVVAELLSSVVFASVQLLLHRR